MGFGACERLLVPPTPPTQAEYYSKLLLLLKRKKGHVINALRPIKETRKERREIKG